MVARRISTERVSARAISGLSDKIRSIQRGTWTLPANTSPDTNTITEVVLKKASYTHLGHSNTHSTSNIGGQAHSDLINATTINGIVSTGSGSSIPTISFQVVETWP